MKINNVTLEDLLEALYTTNGAFNGNVKFKRCDPANQKKTRWNVTLTVLNSRGLGSRISPSGRRIAAACWHVHGTFIDALPPHAEVYTSVNRWTKPHSQWQDKNIGSILEPMRYSDACDCGWLS